MRTSNKSLTDTDSLVWEDTSGNGCRYEAQHHDGSLWSYHTVYDRVREMTDMHPTDSPVRGAILASARSSVA